ncbi:MAG: nucleoside-diphosphate sugar epimerase/dehydratase [Salibacteraceae bacterium]|nr:nucleoside-diphosphate sugar epimerase/dehydratase [Salibacteraceae bacterium]|tara:strand:+ start:37622 stop:39496 length:1875 start_codon:yes stop_codon:yes gene_type:complete
MVIFNTENTPRWIIFTIDLLISIFSLLLAYLLRFNFNIPLDYIETFVYIFPIVLSLRIASFFIFKTYSGIIRYTSTIDMQRIFVIVAGVSILIATINGISFYFVNQSFLIPFSVVIIEYLCTMFLMIAFRITVKLIYFEFKNASKDTKRIVIYGAGAEGIVTKRTLERDEDHKYKVVAFIADKRAKIGKKIEGVTIYPIERLEYLIENEEIDEIIIAVNYLAKTRKQEIVERALTKNVKVLHVPPVKNWINDELSSNQIQEVKIEDLLGREPIHLDSINIKGQLSEKRVLITGAAGSIGSEIVRQVSHFFPSKLILLDQAESPLYDIENEIKEQFGENLCEIVVADVANISRMENVYNIFRPDVVYHCAAYKHVPIMEDNPSEAILTNILGTKIMVDLADKHKVDSFVMVSTDKAVNPTNVMGASKRVAEIYAQSKSKISKTKFITTRFGNVLGSNGSVIPLFKRQIANGGPVCVTHPEITRYFMTIPEACQLVLEAGAMGAGGEIFIFDMGSPIKIIDLAKKMIKLSGLKVGKDIEIKITGLRSGEKLYEELLNNAENTIPTHHPEIMIGKVRDYNIEDIEDDINSLVDSPSSKDNFELVGKIKKLVPEFISQNSIYGKLDKN